MNRLLAVLLCALAPAAAEEAPFWDRLRTEIRKELGKPYVWGAAGLKSFDCSGFVWRVFTDSGLYMNRTTARKMYFSMARPRSGEETRFGTLVFFDHMRHVGIVNSPRDFYHAQSSKGTNLSPMNAFWRAKVCGYRVVKPGEAETR